MVGSGTADTWMLSTYMLPPSCPLGVTSVKTSEVVTANARSLNVLDVVALVARFVKDMSTSQRLLVPV